MPNVYLLILTIKTRLEVCQDHILICIVLDQVELLNIQDHIRGMQGTYQLNEIWYQTNLQTKTNVTPTKAKANQVNQIQHKNVVTETKDLTRWGMGGMHPPIFFS